MERWLTEKYPQNKFIARVYGFKLPLLGGGPVRLNPMKMCLRTMYVVMTTGVAIVFPYFNEVLGVLGAISFWPLAVYFPVEMRILQKKTRVGTRPWLLLRVFSFVSLLVSLSSLVGSIYGLVGAKFRWSQLILKCEKNYLFKEIFLIIFFGVGAISFQIISSIINLSDAGILL